MYRVRILDAASRELGRLDKPVALRVVARVVSSGSPIHVVRGIPGCRVILDRRAAERRRDQRPMASSAAVASGATGALDGACGVVVFLR